MDKIQPSSSANFHYLPLTDATIEEGLYVTSIGFQSVKADEKYPPQIGHPSDYMFDLSTGRRLSDAALVYITAGEGVASSANISELQVSKGWIFVLYPNEWHTYHPLEKTGWSEYWVTFSGRLFETYMHHIASKSEPFVNVGMEENLVRLFTEMISVSEMQKSGYQQTLCGILLHLMGEIQMLVKNKNFNNIDIERIQNARIIMLEKVCERIRPEQIAEELNMSYSNFRKFFKKYTGLAPLQYMLQLKTEKAKELLKHTNRPVKEIALMLNFDSTDYFSSFFHLKVGMSPNEYRMSNCQN